MNVNLNDTLFILIIFQLLFLTFFLFTQEGKGISNKLLGTFFFSICLNLLDVFLLFTGVYFNYPAFAGFGSCIPLVFGPLLFLYTRSVIYKGFSIVWKDMVHFLPFLIFFVGTEFYYLIQSHNVKEELLRNILAHHFPKGVFMVSVLIFIQFVFYAMGSLRLVFLYKKTVNQQFSSPKQTNVSWLYSTIIFFILLMLITTMNGLLTQTSFVKYYLFAFNVVILAVLVFVIQVLMKALRQPYFFSFAGRGDLQGHLPSGKNTLAGTGRSEKEEMIRGVLEHMKNNKPYLEPELTLEQLATQLSIKPRALSQAINEILMQNFFDFINRYRIEEATRMLTKPTDNKITILEVLYQVGFNSKSSFNTLFKKYTGLTPTEFKKKHS